MRNGTHIGRTQRCAKKTQNEQLEWRKAGRSNTFHTEGIDALHVTHRFAKNLKTPSIHAPASTLAVRGPADQKSQTHTPINKGNRGRKIHPSKTRAEQKDIRDFRKSRAIRRTYPRQRAHRHGKRRTRRISMKRNKPVSEPTLAPMGKNDPTDATGPPNKAGPMGRGGERPIATIRN